MTLPGVDLLSSAGRIPLCETRHNRSTIYFTINILHARGRARETAAEQCDPSDRRPRETPRAICRPERQARVPPALHRWRGRALSQLGPAGRPAMASDHGARVAVRRRRAGRRARALPPHTGPGEVRRGTAGARYGQMTRRFIGLIGRISMYRPT